MNKCIDKKLRCVIHDIANPKVIKRKVSVKVESNRTTQYFAETIHDEMKTNIFYFLLDNLVGEIDKRFFTKSLDIITAIETLIKLELDYFKINVTELSSEIRLLKGAENIPTETCSHTVYKWLDWLAVSNHLNLFKSFNRVLSMLVVIPVSSCGCECVFFKNVYIQIARSLLFLFVEQELTSLIDINHVIEEFKVMTPTQRRLIL